MIGFLKRLLGRQQKGKPSPPVVEQGEPPKRVVVVSQEEGVSPATVDKPITPQHSRVEEKGYISISLKSVISTLPVNLRKAVLNEPASDTVIQFSIGRVLPQLSGGAVRITFRELKSASPEGIFSLERSLDNEIIELPLDQILAQTMPLLRRRMDQKMVVVADDIPDVFGTRGERIAEVKVSRKIEKKDSIDEEQRSIPSPAVNVEETERVDLKKVESDKASASSGNTIKGPITNREDLISVEVKVLSQGWPKEIQQKLEENGILERRISIPVDELEPQMKVGKVVFTWEKLSKWIEPQTPNGILSPETNLELPLAIIAPLFLARIRKPTPIKKVVLNEELPDLFEQHGGEAKKEALRIQSEKKEPAQPQIEKPIAIGTAVNERAQISEGKPPSIPISIKPAPTAPKVEPKLPSVSEPIAEKEPIKAQPEKVIAFKQEASRPKTLGEIFNKPDKPIWSPNEVIQHTLSLPGVKGAMIAIKDGLPVVAKLPIEIKPEALAGFVPEIFSKLLHYIEDLKLGQISNVTIACEDCWICVCKSGNIYFVVVGEKDKPAPSIEIFQFIADEFTKPLRK
ncbi:MAG: roadblock/LC7 domain-containing protein [Verrucomicrobiae bacterium]|nr:roadblock/LC7 domain-containing protein [Verrucomicrobiae bacterium]